MKSALFIVTGLVLTAQTFWLLAWGIYGAPTNVWEWLAFFGSLLLITAGITYIWKKIIGAYIVCGSLVLLWSFYVPAIIVSVRSVLVGYAVVGTADWLRTFGIYGLLIAATTVAARDTVRHVKSKS
jgi:hypothetical protein